MKSSGNIHLDFIVDELTNSIRNIITGDSFQTEISRFARTDCKVTLKKYGWNSDWKAELDDDFNEVYKLTIVGNPNIIQGVLSIRREKDHIFYESVGKCPI